jgi:hypothetical protein
MKKVLLTIWLLLIVVCGIAGGWQVAVGIVLLVSVPVGIWVVISGGVDALMRSQEQRSGNPDLWIVQSPDSRKGDPTRPDSEPWPVIEIKDGKWRIHDADQ